MLRKSALLLVLLGCTIYLGCQGGDFQQTGVGGPLNPPPTVSGPLFGRVFVQPMILVDEADQAEVAASRGQLEALGYLVATDGSVIAYQQSPAGYWTVEFGGQTSRTDPGGNFTINAVDGGPSEGILRHPSDQRLFTKFAINRLSSDAQRPGEMAIPLPFPGPCGMTALEDATCSGIGAPPELFPAGAIDGPGVAPRGAPEQKKEMAEGKFRAEPTDVTTGPRGTYADFGADGRAKASDIRCEDKNGPLSAVTSNKYLAYLGSTCDEYVKVGCCPNENAFSDIEYNTLLLANPGATAGRALISELAGQRAFLSGPLNPTSELDCPHNHKGRSCQHVKIGDLSVDIGGSITFANGETTVELCPGQSIELVVHNNGCFGTTFVDKTREEIPGVLTSEGLVNGPGGLELRHFNPTSFGPDPGAPYPTYVTDRSLNFTAPPQARPGSIDSYRFAVDGRSVTVNFVVIACEENPPPPPPPSQTPPPPPPPLIRVSPDISSSHQVGVSPCPQLIGSLAIGNDSDRPVDITITILNGAIETDGPLTLQLPPGGAALQDVFFNCATQSSFQTAIRVTATDSGGGRTELDVKVSMTITP